jgi:HPt (histidine-containing phosphotransfer) domain-containing protein
MSIGSNHKTFIFSSHFNSQYISELYEDDHALIEETFQDVLKEYGPLQQQVFICYRSGDIPALKSAVHKLKPLLGYVGLTTVQSECQKFENNCERDVFPTLDEDFAALSANLTLAKTLIEEEKARLQKFLYS